MWYDAFNTRYHFDCPSVEIVLYSCALQDFDRQARGGLRSPKIDIYWVLRVARRLSIAVTYDSPFQPCFIHRSGSNRELHRLHATTVKKEDLGRVELCLTGFVELLQHRTIELHISRSLNKQYVVSAHQAIWGFDTEFLRNKNEIQVRRLYCFGRLGILVNQRDAFKGCVRCKHRGMCREENRVTALG